MTKLSYSYRQAAKLVETSSNSYSLYYGRIKLGRYWRHWGCCTAICGQDNSDTLRDALVTVFKPNNRNYGDFWFGIPYRLTKEENKKQKDHRVFALLFMAELAKDQGL